MQFYDLVMLAVMGIAIFFGYWKGFAWQVASLAAIFVSYFVARNFNEPVANMIGGDPAWNRFLAMFILFLGCSLVIWLGFGFVKSSIERMHLKGFDRQIGAALGAAKGAVICIIITLFGVSLLGEQTCRSICTSKSGNYIARILGHAGNVVPEEIGQYIDPYIDKFHSEMEEYQDYQPPTQPNSDSQPGFLNPWSTSSSQGFTERIGNLQPSSPEFGQQPVFNGTTGQWESVPQNSGNSGPGQFQPPSLPPQSSVIPANWQDTARDTMQEAADSALQKVWERSFNGNR